MALNNTVGHHLPGNYGNATITKTGAALSARQVAGPSSRGISIGPQGDARFRMAQFFRPRPTGKNSIRHAVNGLFIMPRSGLPQIGGTPLLAALLTLYGIYLWFTFGSHQAPPGSDPGNWLAFSLELFGDDVKAADATYPPVIPLLLRPMLWLMPPLVALKVLGILAAVSVSLPLYLLLRTTLNERLSAVLAASAAAAGYHSEVLAWGGYPQLLGAAFVVLTVHLLLKGIDTGQSRFFAGSGLVGALAAGTHSLAAIQLAIAIAVILGIHLYRQRRHIPPAMPTQRLLKMLSVWMVTAGIAFAPAVPFYVRTAISLGGDPANPQDFSLIEFIGEFASWDHKETYAWMLLGLAGSAISVSVSISRRHFPLANAATSLLIAAGSTLAFLPEIRSAHLLEIGILLSAGVVLVLARSGTIPLVLRFGPKTVRTGAIWFVVLCLSAVLFFSQQRAQDAFDWFLVADSQVLEALDWLKDHSEPGDIVVANADMHGGVIGWWVEGYARRPAYMAIDTRWLIFEEERHQAETAQHILSPFADPATIRDLAATHNVRFIVACRRTLDVPVRTLVQAGFAPEFRNAKMTVLRYHE